MDWRNVASRWLEREAGVRVLGYRDKRAAIALIVGCISGIGWFSAPGLGLPPAWHYELVSPSDSLGHEVGGAVASVDGDHAWITSLVPISPAQGTGNPSALAAVRTSDGWVIRGLTDPAIPNDYANAFYGRSVDSRAVLVLRCPEAFIGCTSDPIIWYRVENPSSPLFMLQIPRRVGASEDPTIAGFSDDLFRLVLSYPPDFPHLLSDDTHTQGHGLYLSDRGQLEYLAFDENGAVLPCGASVAKGFHGSGFEQNGISADASTVAFESPDPTASCPGPVDVYVRRDGVSVDVSRPTDGQPDLGASYLGSSRDGSTVYFTSRSQLVSDASGHEDIYRFDLPTQQVERITPGVDVSQAVVSPDGRYVYFSTPDLLDGQGQSGADNVFVAHENAIDYIASGPTHTVFLGFSAFDIEHYAPVTPDGTHIVFPSSAPLTDQPTGGFRQLFRYDATDHSLTCISCPPDGSTPTGRATFGSPNAANVDERAQSDDGRLVAFETSTNLLPQDINDPNTTTDVYMWLDGRLSLVSSGHSEAPSFLIGTDAAGNNIFFLTNDRLVPGLEQDNRKLYDARTGPGFPTPSPAHCPDCQTLTSPPSTDSPAASETLHNTATAAPRTHVRLGRITRTQLQHLAHTGHLTITITNTQPTKARIRLYAHLHTHWRLSDLQTHTLTHAGATHITFHLSPTARNQLTNHHTLTIRITITTNTTTIQRTLTLHGG